MSARSGRITLVPGKPIVVIRTIHPGPSRFNNKEMVIVSEVSFTEKSSDQPGNKGDHSKCSQRIFPTPMLKGSPHHRETSVNKVTFGTAVNKWSNGEAQRIKFQRSYWNIDSSGSNDRSIARCVRSDAHPSRDNTL